MGEKEYIVGNQGDPLLGDEPLHNSFLNPESKEPWPGTQKSRAFVADRIQFSSTNANAVDSRPNRRRRFDPFYQVSGFIIFCIQTNKS
jgi:hypothetical protein